MASPTDGQTAASFVVCPDCGASLAPGAETCWLCRLRLPYRTVNPVASPIPIERPPAAAAQPLIAPQPSVAAPPLPIADHPAPLVPRGPIQFSLSSILLVITLVAVCLGVFRISYVLGVVLLALATPALLRTVLVSSAEKRRGQRSTMVDKVNTFAASIGVVILAGMAGIAACFAACLPLSVIATAPDNPKITVPLLMAATIVGIGVGLWATVRVVRYFAPHRP